ncbi:MAG: hypothetical protein ACK452_11365 [Bacteroidota bacterium]
MDNSNQNKTHDEFFNILMNNANSSDLDEFEREAIEGWQLVDDVDKRRSDLNKAYDLNFNKSEESKKSTSLYWVAIAASLIIVIGLIFMLSPNLLDNNNLADNQNDLIKRDNFKINEDDHTNQNNVTVKTDTLIISDINNEQVKKINDNSAIKDDSEKSVAVESKPKNSLNKENLNKNLENYSISEVDDAIVLDDTKEQYDLITKNSGTTPLANDNESSVVSQTSSLLDEVKIIEKNSKNSASANVKKSRSKAKSVQDKSFVEERESKNENANKDESVKIELYLNNNMEKVSNLENYPGNLIGFKNDLLKNTSSANLEINNKVEINFKVNYDGNILFEGSNCNNDTCFKKSEIPKVLKSLSKFNGNNSNGNNSNGNNYKVIISR